MSAPGANRIGLTRLEPTAIIFARNWHEKRKQTRSLREWEGSAMRFPLFAALAGSMLATAASAQIASAQEVTLRAVTSFAEGTQFSKNFERFIQKVNADGKGTLQINYIGGPPPQPPLQGGHAVRPHGNDIAKET